MSDNPVSPISTEGGFAAGLRDRTKGIHRLAERSGFVADLLRGRATRAGYALFLRNLHPVYAALEASPAAMAGDPLAETFTDPRLHRRLALENDLMVLGGADWAALPLLTPALGYATAVAAAVADPGGLVGHAYARYLGDLSGGQILKPLLARALSLRPDALTFYEFPGFPDTAIPKAAMRSALDRVPIDGPLATGIAEAAIAAFEHNIAVSEAVASAIGAAPAASLAEA